MRNAINLSIDLILLLFFDRIKTVNNTMVIKKKKEDIKKIVKYWLKTTEHDFETMNALFGIKRYPESLFFGHIVLEKILKGLVAEEIEDEAPYIHNLTKLAELAKCDLFKEEMDLLDDANKFNIRARYSEYKLQFYKQCNREYAKNYIDKISNLYKKLLVLSKLKYVKNNGKKNS